MSLLNGRIHGRVCVRYEGHTLGIIVVAHSGVEDTGLLWTGGDRHTLIWLVLRLWKPTDFGVNSAIRARIGQ